MLADESRDGSTPPEDGDFVHRMCSSAFGLGMTHLQEFKTVTKQCEFGISGMTPQTYAQAAIRGG
jgi:hypothetical protein